MLYPVPNSFDFVGSPAHAWAEGVPGIWRPTGRALGTFLGLLRGVPGRALRSKDVDYQPVLGAETGPKGALGVGKALASLARARIGVLALQDARGVSYAWSAEDPMALRSLGIPLPLARDLDTLRRFLDYLRRTDRNGPMAGTGLETEVGELAFPEAWKWDLIGRILRGSPNTNGLGAESLEGEHGPGWIFLPWVGADLFAHLAFQQYARRSSQNPQFE